MSRIKQNTALDVNSKADTQCFLRDFIIIFMPSCFFLIVSPGPHEKTINVSHKQTVAVIFEAIPKTDVGVFKGQISGSIERTLGSK